MQSSVTDIGHYTRSTFLAHFTMLYQAHKLCITKCKEMGNMHAVAACFKVIPVRFVVMVD
jgi:hypothetical protein